MSVSQKGIIVPSLLSADMARFAEAIELLEGAGCGLFHVDIMDGHFVPNMTFGPPVVSALSKAVKDAKLCVHLMVEQPEKLIDKYMSENVEYLTVHAEACPHLHRTLQQIRELGAKPGVALNPGTSPHVVEYALEEADLVLVMTVNPGFGGQKFINATVRKIETFAQWRDEREGYDYVIEVDGGVYPSTATTVLEAGARLLVAGNAVYGADDPVAAYKELSALAGKYE